MRELPVVEGLRARITNETADQRPQKEGASLRLPFPPLYQLLSFHSTKTFVNVSSYKGSEISLNSFQKFWKLLNFRNANHSTENSRNSGSKVEGKENRRYPGYQRFFSRCSGNFRCVGWAYLPRSSSFSKFWNYSLSKVAKNSHRTFWLNGKRPVFSVSSVAWAISVLSFYSKILELLKGIDLVTVFDAILTRRQTREKLQCLYENLMSNNFRKTAVLKKTSVVN